jgi:hypothetical protein
MRSLRVAGMASLLPLFAACASTPPSSQNELILAIIGDAQSETSIGAARSQCPGSTLWVCTKSAGATRRSPQGRCSCVDQGGLQRQLSIP